MIDDESFLARFMFDDECNEILGDEFYDLEFN